MFTKDYSRIIDHPHYQSSTRQPMPMIKRAAQFAPFAALSGYAEAVNETMRETEAKRKLDEDEQSNIDHTLRYAMLSHKPVCITYYLPDPTKPGGSYMTLTGRIHKADMLEDVVIMEDGSAILMYNIINAEIMSDIAEED